MAEYLIQAGAKSVHVNVVRYVDDAQWRIPKLSVLLGRARSPAMAVLRCDEELTDDDTDTTCRALTREPSTWSTNDRVKVLVGLSASHHDTLIKLTGSPSVELSRAPAPSGSTLLHLFADSITGYGPRFPTSYILEYGLRACGRDHARDTRGLTPFCNLLVSSSLVTIERVLVVWLEHAHRAGVDLHEYGRVELEHLRNLQHNVN